ncbi:Y-family DNA polymerase [Lichenicoccus roseus]|uniref:DNA-directed DNA polymerase n=1 Tax=Lichenicoccus roseus TaxID=2683649 RepID=A0A5R9J004_9PROT|nr:DNA polymerase Y family protein [Lichenicoccus roseus]TLU70862.1 DNA polymerase Y family protein [Lichenicoccus roseus]
MRRVVSLWLPFWPTDRLRKLHGDAPADGSPLVTRGHDGRRMVIAAADQAARALGLCAGMPLAHAQAMVPDLAVLDATPAEDAEALARLAAWCLRLSPLTAPDAPDGVWIDVTGCAHLHGGERPMLTLLARQLARHRLAGRMAIADTPGAAHAMARFGSKPIAVVEPGGQAEALAPLPVEALRLDAQTVDGLRRLGLERVGQLAEAARGPLARRFGDIPLTRLDQATGRAREPIRPVLPPETIMVRRTFVEPIATAEAFTGVILTLVGEACAQLEQRGEGARRLDLVFERVDATIQVVRIGTARPVRDVRHLARLLDERIETVDPGLGVEAMRLVLPSVEPLAYTQRSGDLAPDATQAADLSELIDRLVNRLGADKVYRLQPVESDIPERSQQAVPALALMAKGAPGPPVCAWPRPARLLDPPEPVDAMAMMPDHPPRAFTWRRVRHRIARADGPERIHGEWWDRPDEVAAVRDYWIVENQHGRRFWLFRQGDGVDPATGELAWFLHGLF